MAKIKKVENLRKKFQNEKWIGHSKISDIIEIDKGKSFTVILESGIFSVKCVRELEKMIDKRKIKYIISLYHAKDNLAICFYQRGVTK